MLNLWHLKHILELTLIKGLFSLSKSCNLLFLCDKKKLGSDGLCIVKNLPILQCVFLNCLSNFVLFKRIPIIWWKWRVNIYIYKFEYSFCKKTTKDEVEMESDKKSQWHHDRSLAVDDDQSLTARSSTSSHSAPYHQTAIGINIFML